MKLNKLIAFLFICQFILIGFQMKQVFFKVDIDMNKYISKSQCIPLPSSNVNEYWACKKEVKK
jgi:hypothetical protein